MRSNDSPATLDVGVFRLDISQGFDENDLLATIAHDKTLHQSARTRFIVVGAGISWTTFEMDAML